MPIAELFLGALLAVLFERLASRELLNFARREGIDKLLKKWEKMLISINQVLDDAEDRQLIDNVGVKLWLEDLRNLAYDIEDLLDEFTTKSAEKKSKAKPCTRKVCFLLPSCDFILSPCAFMSDCKMRSKIKEMDGRLKDLITRKDTLNLKENNENRLAYRRQDKPLPTTSLPDSYFISREDDRRKILKLLMGEGDDRTCADLEVIPIVGMGGIGKTALVQQVYKEAEENNYFDVQAWTCVSDDFDVLTITKRILQTTNENFHNEDKDLNLLQIELKKHFMGKKFLVVLDDVWNEEYEKWTTLLKPFQSGVKGSKIILTTRNSGVASLAGASARSYYLKELSPDACMTLFAFHALGVENFNHHPHLRVLGQKIAEKCKGLPLAVKALAGLLCSNVNPQDWEAILNNKIWDLPEDRNKILPALKLSYLHLPFHLRRCFAYCAIFPKDYEIEQDELIHWWIAEGLLEGRKEKNSWNAGLNYFNELVSRSLFQKSSINESRFLMHDLVNDLAKLVAGATYFSPEEFEFEGNQSNASFARHASFIPSYDIVSKNLEIYHRMKGLRSFISLQKQYDSTSFLSQKVLCDLLSTVKYLRMLSLSRYNIREVPDCLGKLRHLRHLNLSYTNIEMLPKSIVALYNLEALMLQACEYLTELPEDMEKLINLKFLDITDTPNLRGMPMYIGKLVGLEMLSKFIVGTGNGLRLNELKNLKNLKGKLCGKLCISDLHKVQEVGDAKEIDLITKEGIRWLTMQWSPNFEISRNEGLEADVLIFLHPHRNLENLVISYYGGLKFPSWLESPPHLNIVHLRLHGCHRANTLPSLGQLSLLKELYIEGLDAICTIGSGFYGNDDSSFPSLITLEFKDMPLWEDWSHCIGIEEAGVLFPHLEHLLIQDCPVLKGKLPSQLGSLTKLIIKSCPHMDALPSIISLPSLRELQFGGCNEKVLKSLVNLTSLTSLVIEDVSELTCLNHGFTSSLIKLEELQIERCEKLTYLWQDRDVIQNLTCLKRLSIKMCPEFMYFVAEEGDIELPGNLETICLSDCIKLEKLPSKMHTLYSLRDLSVEECPNLVSFPKTGIPTSMISLHIFNCNRLQHLPRGLNVDLDELSSINTQGDKMSGLQSLEISFCAALFSEGIYLPITLKSLIIHDCQNVESLERINLDSLQSLQKIEIYRCHKLRSLPQGLNTFSSLNSLRLNDFPALQLECFPPLPPGISTFGLQQCPKIKSLPNQLHRLTSLQRLEILWCESITRFPDGGLPPQLQVLEVIGCKNMKQPVREWLAPLTSLQILEIDGSVGGLGEEEDLVLPFPSSVLELYIEGTGKVKRLSSSLPPSLQILYIGRSQRRVGKCPELRELPQDGLPPSLRDLWIFNCPKLRKLPQVGLPPSLEFLWIQKCGILEKRCRKGTGSDWPLIREIPRVTLGHYFSKLIT